MVVHLMQKLFYTAIPISLCVAGYTKRCTRSVCTRQTGAACNYFNRSSKNDCKTLSFYNTNSQEIKLNYETVQ